MNQKKSKRHAKNKATGKYVRQRERTERNRKLRQKRHAEENPNDTQGQ